MFIQCSATQQREKETLDAHTTHMIRGVLQNEGPKTSQVYL